MLPLLPLLPMLPLLPLLRWNAHKHLATRSVRRQHHCWARVEKVYAISNEFKQDNKTALDQKKKQRKCLRAVNHCAIKRFV